MPLDLFRPLDEALMPDYHRYGAAAWGHLVALV
jgi:hypothetical protein